jgi:signal transduction histidine kinase
MVARSLAAAAHSVNNALLVISGTVELLETAPGPQQALPSALERIRTQSETAAEAMREVMDFARADVVSQTHIDLHDVAARAVAMRQFATRRARCRLSFVPAGEAPLTVRGNTALLLQALLNLIVNAEEAVAGAAGAEIRLEASRDHTHAHLRVTDSGAGVAADQRERVFEPWVGTRNRDEHVGLGLPVARHIAERHGGSVSLVTKGSAVVLSLPLALGR